MKTNDLSNAQGFKNSRLWEVLREAWNALWPIAVLLVSYLLLYRVLMLAGRLPETAYERSFLAPSLIARLGVLWVPALVCCVVLAVRLNFDFTWKPISEAKSLRIFATLLAALLAWNYVALDCNLYFDQWYLWDRLILIALVPLVYYFPVAIFPFLFLLVAFQNQLYHPSFLPQLWPEKMFAVRVLALLGAFYALVGITKRQSWPLPFLLLVFVAAHYWPSAISKVQLGWVQHNDLSNVIFSAYANGWQPWLSHEEVAAVSKADSGFSFLAGVYTQLAELAPILLAIPLWACWRRKGNDDHPETIRWWVQGISLLILFLAAMLHVGIWVKSGICFLNWIVVDLAIMMLLWNKMRSQNQDVKFTWVHQILFVGLVLSGAKWIETTSFTWFETRACYSYRLKGVMATGEELPISAKSMAPYDFPFTWTLHGYLYPEKQLAIRYGNARRAEVAIAINQIRSEESLWQLEDETGEVRFDEVKKARYIEFVKRFFQNYNRRGKQGWLDFVQRPAEIISSPSSSDFSRQYNKDGKVESIKVERVTTFFDGEKYRELRKEHLFEIPLDP